MLILLMSAQGNVLRMIVVLVLSSKLLIKMEMFLLISRAPTGMDQLRLQSNSKVKCSLARDKRRK
jgi:hypothetical protein